MAWLQYRQNLIPNIQYLQSLFGSIATDSTDLRRAAQILVFRDGPEIWEKKLRYLASFGLRDDEIKELVGKCPAVLETSTDKMQKNMYLLIYTAKLPPNIVLNYPMLLCYSVEGRLKPRLKVLKSKSAMQPSERLPNLAAAFHLGNLKFLDNCVKRSPDAAKLLEIYSGEKLANGSSDSSWKLNKFDKKIEASSAKMYFHYYGQLLHQQNMLQDYVRTGSYYAAVIENRIDFHGRVVVDVGAGSGILSLFAAQAGAKHVYAVEASEMVDYARRLVAGNPSLGQHITVIKGKIEEVELPEKADILISEPMGTLLLNERMLESYVIARDRFLSPTGKMFPTIGRIHMAPFSDEYLYVEIANKALFWQQQNYYGVDLTPLHGPAFQCYFSQPVVDAFDPRLLVAPPISHTIDFTKVKEEELYEIDIPLNFTASVGTRVHGLACWFDVLFNGSAVQRWLTTAPGAPTTHWYQLRCVLSQPIYVMAGQVITGRLHMVAHSAQSYTMYLTMSAKMWGAGADQGGILQTSSSKLDLKEPYYRMSQPQVYAWSQDQSTQQLVQQQANGIPSQQVDGPILVQQPIQASVILQQQQHQQQASQNFQHQSLFLQSQ